MALEFLLKFLKRRPVSLRYPLQVRQAGQRIVGPQYFTFDKYIQSRIIALVANCPEESTYKR